MTPSHAAPTVSGWPAATVPKRWSRRSRWSTGLPFVCVSAGTRNHFALDLGLNRDDPRESMYAFRDAIERRVDYATVNDRFFVNNVSLGVYAKIVQEESYRDAKLDTTKVLLPEMLGREAEPFDLQFTTPDGTDGRRRDRRHGVEQPVRDRGLARQRPASPPRSRQARDLRSDDEHGLAGGALCSPPAPSAVAPGARSGTSSARPISSSAPDRGARSPGSTGKHSSCPPRCSSASTIKD